MAFADLSTRAQVVRLRAVAVAALAHYPLDVRRLRLVNHGFNTTFRVDTHDDRRFALRINVNSQRRPEWIAAEMSWQEAIVTDTDLTVPAPQRTRAGGLVTRAHSPDLGRELDAVLYSWLPGPDLGDTATPRQMREVGRALAILHTHAERWRPPPGTELPLFDEPLFGAPDRLTGGHPLVGGDQQAVLAAALTETRRHHRELFTGSAPIALHADLHQWNTKWHRGRLSLFDFDDSGFGVPLQDLAISAYYVRRVDRRLEDALHEGYASVRPLPDGIDAHYEALLASRNVLLVNDVLDTLNREMRDALPGYVATSVHRLAGWLDTGVYRSDATPTP